MTIAEVLEKLDGVRAAGDGKWSARCPAHDDHRASLAIAEGDDGKVLVTCHALCSVNAICAALGLEVRDLFPKPNERPAARATSGRTIAATYDYTDEHGVVLFQVVRFAPKDFRPRRPDATAPDGWTWNLTNTRRVLYKLPALLAADPAAMVYIVEGEKDVDALAVLGLVATTNPGGAGKWRDDYNEPLRNRHVVILPDNDDAGRAHAEKVAASLGDVAASVRVVALPGLPDKGDVSDWIAGGGTRAALEALVAEANSADSAEQTEPWGAPLPLDAVACPPFPLDALPPILRAQVVDVARVVQVAPDLPAAIGLGVIAAACARRVAIAIGHTHVEPVNLYVAPVATSGERKGPTFRAMLAPLYAVERELRTSAAPIIAAAEEARRGAEKRLEHLRTVAAKLDDPTERAARDAEAQRLATERPPVPPKPTLVVGDRTPEKLELDLAEQGGALLLADEEAGTLFAIAGGRYSRDGSSQLDTFLKAYDGGVIATGRISRESVDCDAPALSIIVTPQPIVLDQFRERREFHDRGLLPRFLWVLVPSRVGQRFHDTAAAPTASVRQAYEAMVRRLLALPRPSDVATVPTLRLEGAALDRWRQYADRVEADMRAGGVLEPIREWASKQPGRVARIAAVLHMIETVGAGRPWTECPTADTVAAACTLGEWAEAHALAAYDMMAADPRRERARLVLAWLRRTTPTCATFTARAAFSALDRRRFETMADLEPSLALLVEYNHLRVPTSARRGGRGRPGSPTYEVNPATLQNAPQNTQKSPATDSEANSAYSAEHSEPLRGPEVWL